MTSHLVVTSEEESFVTVARYISELLDQGQVRTALADTPGSVFFRECEDLFAEAQFLALLDKFLDNFDVLFSKAADSDLEASLNVCVHLLDEVPDNVLPGAIEKLAKAFIAKADDHAEQRLSALVQLFNVATDPNIQYHILLEAIAYAKATDKPTLLAPAIRNRIDTWAKEWELSIAEQQRLYLAAADLLRANKKRKALLKEAYKLTIRALSTMQDAAPQNLGDVKQIASSAVSEFIRSQDVFQFDLLESPAVRQLEDDPKQAPLYQLLRILFNGDVKGLKSFLQSQPSIVESIGTTVNDLETKTRLMALLALTATENRVDFATIQERLGLDNSSEVEEWLVKGMGKKLIEGQMDQVKKQVTITKASYRTFSQEHWHILQKQLAAWKANVQNVKDLVQHSENAAIKPVPNGVQA